MEKKLRIQLFDPEGKLVSDRLVTQDPEFNAGPKIVHDGPIRIEFTFENTGDIEKANTYLNQLTGILPKPESRGRKVKNVEMGDDESRSELLKEALEQANDQDALISYLRSHDFVFLTWDFLKTFEFPIDIKKKHEGEYQWMVRQLKRAKNPRSDKYDPMLLIGIKLIGERSDRVVVYLNGEFEGSHKITIPGKPKETYKKSGMMKFHAAMTFKERDKFRFELRQYQFDPNRPLSKFFIRWSPFVDNVPELENPRE